MAIHSSNLAWGIPWSEKPGGLYSMGSQRVRHDCMHAFLVFICLAVLHLSCGMQNL